jgi:hypothetical protein
MSKWKEFSQEAIVLIVMILSFCITSYIFVTSITGIEYIEWLKELSF